MEKSLLSEKLIKLLDLLTSRKFLAAVVSLLVVFKVLPDGQENGVLEAILTVVTAFGYILSVAIEDGMSASAPDVNLEITRE